MREIKFRAWWKDAKIMVNVDVLKRDGGIEFSHPVIVDGFKYNEDGLLDEETQYELMQFTGLFDKNGKEIYEGDVVRSNDGERNYVDEVSFSYIHGVAFGKERYADLGLPHGFTCIGNIYEHDHLLKDK